MKLLPLLLLIIISCNQKTNEPITEKEGAAKYLAQRILPNGGKDVGWFVRVIAKNIKYDSSQKKDVIATTKKWYFEKTIPIIDDKTKQQKKDSLGNLLYKFDYEEVPIDSINTHVENIPFDSLVKPGKPAFKGS